MSPLIVILIFLLLAAGFAALELLLPSYGILSIASGLCVLIAVAACFSINQWVGVGALAITVLSAPVVLAVAFKIYPHTPVGRRMVLTTNAPTPTVESVRVGQQGTTTTALRPMGEAEFGVLTIQVISQTGTPINAGTRIEVVASRSDGVAVVRETQA
jgi:membrane-bound ClpP family serine protease